MADDKAAGAFDISLTDEPRDRATVALVASELREVRAIIAGHAEVTAVKLDAINDRMAPLAGVTDRIARLEERQESLHDRVTEIEDAGKKHRDWRRAAVTTAVFASIGVLINLAIAFHWFG